MVSTEEIFQELQNLHENQFCFECGVKSNSWASTNNGIFLCLKCSGIHRTLGANYSFIRSINLDSWNEKQINYMRNGGNANLKAYFSRYKIAPDSPIDYKFKTKAAQYYRDKLKAIVEGEEFYREPPSLEEGLEIFDSKNSANNLQSPGNSQYEPIAVDKVNDKKGFDKFKSQVTQMYDKTTESAKHTLSNLNTKIKDAHIGDDIKKFGNKVADKSKEYGEIASKKAKEGVANMKEYFNKKGRKNDQKDDPNQYEEIKDEQIENKNEDNENKEDAQKQEESVEKLPEKIEENKNNVPPPEQKKTNFFSRGFSSVVNSTKSAVSKINKKLDDPEFKKKVSDFKEKVSHTTKQIGEKTTEIAKKGYTGIKEGIGKIKDKNKDKKEDINDQNVQNK